MYQQGVDNANLTSLYSRMVCRCTMLSMIYIYSVFVLACSWLVRNIPHSATMVSLYIVTGTRCDCGTLFHRCHDVLAW